MKASPALEARIHQIKQECGGTKADVVRDGINLLYHLLYQLPEGSEICYKTPDGKVTELVIMYTGGKIEPKGRKPHQ
jgi:hypothetical protein